MRPRLLVLAVLGLTLMATYTAVEAEHRPRVSATVYPTICPAIAPTIAPGVNMLVSPGFELAEGESDYAARQDPYTGELAPQLRLARGWEPWFYNEHVCPPHDPNCNPFSYNRRPEYKRETPPGRVRSGQSAQKYFTSYGTHLGGMYQLAQVPAGSWVRFSAWVWVWSSHKDVPAHSFRPGEYGVSLGIDPSGGELWDSPSIQWTVPITQYDRWVHLETAARASADRVSVWARSAQRLPVEHNDSYWDDAELIVLASAPTPTTTPLPTATPYPTPAPDAPTPMAPCSPWRTWHEDTFDGPSLDDWGSDPADGAVQVTDGTLSLTVGSAPGEAFALAWTRFPWPSEGAVRLSLRFAYRAPTSYGTTLGLGSQPYDGERYLAEAPEPWGIEDILHVHQRYSGPGTGEFGIDLLGVRAWTGAPGDTSWHSLSLTLRDTVYSLEVDGAPVGRGVSYWRPQSLYVGNPVILWTRGYWTEVAVDDVRVETCLGGTFWPIVLR